MKTQLILLLACILCTFSCKETKTVPKVITPKPSTTQMLPPAPESFIFKMYEEVDHIDYMFRNTNFSISQDEKGAVQATISTLSPSPPNMVSDTCKSPIRMTFLAQGNILVETEMYMTNGCQFVEYHIDGVKTYHNNYSQEGYNFLLSLINQAKNAAPPQ